MQEKYPELTALVQKLNKCHGLELDPEYVEELYGESVVQTIAQDPEGFEEKVLWLLEKGFAETTADICNRFGILLCQCSEDFIAAFDALIQRLGTDYADQIAEDLSILEELM